MTILYDIILTSLFYLRNPLYDRVCLWLWLSLVVCKVYNQPEIYECAIFRVVVVRRLRQCVMLLW